MPTKRKTYQFNDDLQFGRPATPLEKILKTVLQILAGGLVLAVLFSLFVTLFVTTAEDARLRAETKLYQKIYPEIQANEELLSDAVEALSEKDKAVYGDIFHSEAPNLDPIASLDFLFGADSIPETSMISYTRAKVDDIFPRAEEVEMKFARIMEILSDPETVIPPMRMPMKDVSYTQVGASCGMKLNPFYKTRVRHNGIDFIAHQGEPVYASAKGRVSSVVRSNKGLGNVVEITHDGGYKTKYAHLSSISVGLGQSVEAGKKIGSVGMTGSAYAPHLHYEILLDGRYLDPSGYFFGSVGCSDFANILYVAANTQQSMD